MECNCKKLRRPGDTEGKGGEHVSPIFLRSKKKGKQKKKEKVLKQKLLKGCHQGQNVTVLAILEHLEFKHFFVGQPCWSTILFSVPWPLHFEFHFAGPVATNRSFLLADICLLIREESSKQIAFEDQVPAIYFITLLHLYLFTYDHWLADSTKN